MQPLRCIWVEQGQNSTLAVLLMPLNAYRTSLGPTEKSRIIAGKVSLPSRDVMPILVKAESRKEQ